MPYREFIGQADMNQLLVQWFAGYGISFLGIILYLITCAIIIYAIITLKERLKTPKEVNPPCQTNQN